MFEICCIYILHISEIRRMIFTCLSDLFAVVLHMFIYFRKWAYSIVHAHSKFIHYSFIYYSLFEIRLDPDTMMELFRPNIYNKNPLKITIKYWQIFKTKTNYEKPMWLT